MCNFATNQKMSLEMHLAEKHDEKFSCDDCTFRGKTSFHLNRHIHNIHSSNKVWPDLKKIFHCAACDVSYPRNSSLKQHENTVQLKLKHKCSMCKYEAIQISHL